MTDLATPATETVAPATPARTGSSGSAWVKWLARRIGLAILTLWLCSVLVFFATAALGDPVRAILGKDYAASPERAAALAAAAPARPAGDRALLRLARRPAHRQPRHLDRQRAAGRRAGRRPDHQLRRAGARLGDRDDPGGVRPRDDLGQLPRQAHRRRHPGRHDHPGRAAGVRRRHPAGGAVLHHRVPRAARGHDRGRRRAAVVQPRVDDPAGAHARDRGDARTCPGSCAPACSKCSTATTWSWPGSRACRNRW